jgi:hypothetical protein
MSNNDFQKLLVNTLSLSETIVLGRPCNLTILLRNVVATEDAVYGCFNGKKCTYLENLSITTKITK